MTRRVLLVSVVGALLAGSAVTGTTRASWVDQGQLAGSTVASGAMAFSATTPAAVTVAGSAGSAATTSLTLTDTSVGKKLQQRITTSVSSTPTGVSATVGTSCPGTASVQVSTTPGSAVPLCVRVASSATAVSGTVTLRVSGQQQPSGWTTPVSTVSVPVTVVTAAPVISCLGATQNGFGWPAVTGATQYVVTSSDAQSGTYSDVATQTATSYVPSVAGQSITFWRVRATGPGGSSAASNTVRIVRTGSAYACLELL